MNRIRTKLITGAVSTIAAVVLANASITVAAYAAAETEVSMPASAADYAAEAAKSEQEAKDLDAKAEKSLQLSRLYQVRSAGANNSAVLQGFARQYERMASMYRDAAKAARDMSKMQLTHITA